jgi:hypothetical protein
MTSGALSGVQVACELAEMGSHMVEARFRREHPDASGEEVAEHVRRWWIDRPGAPVETRSASHVARDDD